MSHDDLTQSIRSLGMKERDAMALLQDNGIISDNCVDLVDIAHTDIPMAIKYLKVSHGVLI